MMSLELTGGMICRCDVAKFIECCSRVVSAVIIEDALLRVSGRLLLIFIVRIGCV